MRVKPVSLPEVLYKNNKKFYMDYMDHYKMLIADLNQKMSKANRQIYLFGAHVFAQFLVEMGLNTDKVVCLLDNDPNKQWRRLYGTYFKVASLRILSGADNPIVILKVGVYNKEIRKIF